MRKVVIKSRNKKAVEKQQKGVRKSGSMENIYIESEVDEPIYIILLYEFTKTNNYDFIVIVQLLKIFDTVNIYEL